MQQRPVGENVQNAVVPVEREIHDDAIGRSWKLYDVFHQRVWWVEANNLERQVQYRGRAIEGQTEFGDALSDELHSK